MSRRWTDDGRWTDRVSSRRRCFAAASTGSSRDEETPPPPLSRPTQSGKSTISGGQRKPVIFDPRNHFHQMPRSPVCRYDFNIQMAKRGKKDKRRRCRRQGHRGQNGEDGTPRTESLTREALGPCRLSLIVKETNHLSNHVQGETRVSNRNANKNIKVAATAKRRPRAFHSAWIPLPQSDSDTETKVTSESRHFSDPTLTRGAFKNNISWRLTMR